MVFILDHIEGVRFWGPRIGGNLQYLVVMRDRDGRQRKLWKHSWDLYGVDAYISDFWERIFPNLIIPRVTIQNQYI